jgi:general secretion pathway protein K
MMRASQRLRRKVGDSRRGMALIVVFTTVAILSTSITEYVYNTRVNLRLAQNQRDEVKAYYLARSGVNLQRLAIAYQS